MTPRAIRHRSHLGTAGLLTSHMQAQPTSRDLAGAFSAVALTPRGGGLLLSFLRR